MILYVDLLQTRDCLKGMPINNETLSFGFEELKGELKYG